MNTLSYSNYTSELSVLKQQLKHALMTNDRFLANNSFMRLGYQVPVEAFTWITLHPDPSLPLLDLLFHRQLLCDDFIHSFLNSVCASELTVYDVMQHLIAKTDSYCRNDVYFLQELLTGGNPCSLKPFPRTNIIKDYADIMLCVDDIVIETAYFAQPKILSKIVQLIRRYDLNYNFKPFERGKHKAVHTWIAGNFEAVKMGKPPGWICGPDSGKWPSTNIADYEEVWNLLKQLM